MKKKSFGAMLGIYAIVFAVFNLLVFLFLTPVTPVFWISYGFMVLAFLLQILGMFLSFKGNSIQAVFFGIPLAQFTLFYFFAELFMSLVFMIFQMINWKIPVFLQVLLLAIYGVVAIVSCFARDASTAASKKVMEKASAVRVKAIDIEMLRDEAKDPELKTALRRLAETVKYSDPMTTAAIEDVEARIYQETLALRTYCEDQQLQDAKDSCAKLQRLYVERNKKLMASK